MDKDAGAMIRDGIKAAVRLVGICWGCIRCHLSQICCHYCSCFLSYLRCFFLISQTLTAHHPNQGEKGEKAGLQGAAERCHFR